MEVDESIAAMRHARITNTTTNKTKTTTNDCGGIMWKSKQADIFGLAVNTKQWTGVAGAFVEHQHLLRRCVRALFSNCYLPLFIFNISSPGLLPTPAWPMS
jgi:hypothetical protein